MAANVGTIEARVGLDLTELNRNTRQARNTMQSFSGNMQGIANVMKVAFSGIIAKSIFDINSKLVNLASDSSEVNNVIEVSFKGSSDAIKQWSIDTGDAVGRSTYQMKEFVGTAKSMLNGLVGNTDAGTEMSKTLTTLAIDLASFRNISDERAFGALTSAITGNAEALNSLGFNVMEGALKQYALKESIEKSIEKMTVAEKAALRYKLMLKLLNDIQGDATRTAKEYANATKAMKAELRELKEIIGNELKPAFTDMNNKIKDMILELKKIDFEKLKETAKQMFLLAAGIALVPVSLVAIKALVVAFGNLAVILGAINIIPLGIAMAIAVVVGSLKNAKVTLEDFTTFFTDGMNSVLGDLKHLADKGFNALVPIIKSFIICK